MIRPVAGSSPRRSADARTFHREKPERRRFLRTLRTRHRGPNDAFGRLRAGVVDELQLPGRKILRRPRCIDAAAPGRSACDAGNSAHRVPRWPAPDEPFKAGCNRPVADLQARGLHGFNGLLRRRWRQRLDGAPERPVRCGEVGNLPPGR